MGLQTEIKKEDVLKLINQEEQRETKERVGELYVQTVNSFKEIMDCIEACKEAELKAKQELAAYSKEEEIACLEQMIETLKKEMGQALYVLTEEEEIKDKSFTVKHQLLCDSNTHYEISGTGITRKCKKVCPVCKETVELTNQDLW